MSRDMAGPGLFDSPPPTHTPPSSSAPDSPPRSSADNERPPDPTSAARPTSRSRRRASNGGKNAGGHRQPSVGLVCPTDNHHGPLIEIDGVATCIHQEHDGRPASHPLGAAPATRRRFTIDEIEAGQP